MSKVILYARGVDSRHVEKLKKKAKKQGYATLGAYLNEIFKKLTAS
tara:strand:- start:470 stop:607 length:138 start_codon:yes stop_codon:yes gene_type:complete